MDSLCAAADGGADGGGWARPAWLAGVAASAAALLLEALLLLLRPRCRKYDEITLCHLAAARLANSVCEYLMMSNFEISVVATTFFVTYTDLALVCFMFVFSKNLYDRVVVVFAGSKWRAAAAASAVWAAAAPNGALCALLMYYNLPNAFIVYYRVYSSVKFVVLVVNASLFACILRVVCAQGASGTSVRTVAVACALVTLTSLQTLISDLFTVLCEKSRLLTNVFFVINAFQGVHILAIFVMLARKHEAQARARARACLGSSHCARVVLVAHSDSSEKAKQGAREPP